MQRPEETLCYYTILQVDPAADQEEVKKAYKRQARAHHPDKHDHHNKQSAESNFKQIGEAYAVLGDPHERAQYDLSRQRRQRSSFGPPAYEAPFSRRDSRPSARDDDFFSAPFGRSSAFGNDPFGENGSVFGSDPFRGSVFGNMFGGGSSRQDVFNGLMGGESMFPDMNNLFAHAQPQQHGPAQGCSQSSFSTSMTSSFSRGGAGTTVSTQTTTGPGGRRVTVRETTVHNADGTSHTTREQVDGGQHMTYTDQHEVEPRRHGRRIIF